MQTLPMNALMNVLLVDGHTSRRQALADMLQAGAMRVFEAGQVDHLPPETGAEVALFDLDHLGFEGLRRLASTYPQLPIIALASRESADEPASLGEAVEAFKAGATDYLAKPLLPALVYRAVLDARERCRAYQELADKNRELQRKIAQMREDEEAGRRLQFKLLPPNNQHYGAYHFQRQLLTPLSLSGDFIDYFYIDERHLGFYIADVSGHGISSAFVTVLLKSYMSRYLELYRQGKSQSLIDPARILTRLNRNVLDGDMDKHLTMFYGVIEVMENRLTYANGGQFPLPILFDPQGNAFIGDNSYPVGLFDFAEYRNEQLILPAHFGLLMISDGILEALPKSWKFQAKLDFLQNTPHIVDNDIAVIQQRMGLDFTPSQLKDDISFLLIRREPQS